MKEILVPPVRMVSVDKIDGPSENPNAMSASDFDTLCELIRTEGFLQPILVKDMPRGRVCVVDGDHRQIAAKKLGMKEVPCVVLPVGYSESKTKLLQIAMNKLRGNLELGEVAKSLQNIMSAGDIDATLSGFNQEQIQDLLKSLEGSVGSMEDLLGTGDKPPKGGRPTPVEQYVLEIPFETAVQLKNSKKALKALGEGDITVGLLTLLNK